MAIRKFIFFIMAVSCFSFQLNAQNEISSSQILSAKQQSIVQIAALTAKDELQKLKPALNEGLEAGLTINEIKEVLVHLYAYCGFPRSIRGLQTFMEVLEERKSKGITDKIGADASPIKNEPAKYDRGKKVLGELTRICPGNRYIFERAFVCRHFRTRCFGLSSKTAGYHFGTKCHWRSRTNAPQPFWYLPECWINSGTIGRFCECY